jgi:RNA-dependent RNA polymerase
MSISSKLTVTGRWTNYRVTFDSATLTGPKFEAFSNALVDYGVTIENIDQYTIKDEIVSPLGILLQKEISGTHPHLGSTSKPRESVFTDFFASQVHLSFPVRYQLEACLSNGYRQEYNRP